MPKFRVLIDQAVCYEVLVDADDRDQAGERAEELLRQADNRGRYLLEIAASEIALIEPYPVADGGRS